MDEFENTIEVILYQQIREYCLPHESDIELKFETDMFDAGVVDSAGLISLIAFVEEKFDLAIPDEDLLPQNFTTIAAMADYIRTHQRLPDVSN